MNEITHILCKDKKIIYRVVKSVKNGSLTKIEFFDHVSKLPREITISDYSEYVPLYFSNCVDDNLKPIITGDVLTNGYMCIADEKECIFKNLKTEKKISFSEMINADKDNAMFKGVKIDYNDFVERKIDDKVRGKVGSEEAELSELPNNHEGVGLADLPNAVPIEEEKPAEYIDFGLAPYAIANLLLALYNEGIRDFFITKENGELHVRIKCDYVRRAAYGTKNPCCGFKDYFNSIK